LEKIYATHLLSNFPYPVVGWPNPLNAITGEVLARRNLASDAWFMNLATVPNELVPRSSVEATIDSGNTFVPSVKLPD
jgi:hypothetical protein